ncbi:MAG: DUF5652 family protein [archaeon]
MAETMITLLADNLGISVALLFIVVIWSIVWKAIALWKSARNNHLIWFIVLLVVNLLGILEMLYIFVFSKMGRYRIKPIKVPKPKPIKISKSKTKKKFKKK